MNELPETMTLGQINDYLHPISISSKGLEELGFPAFAIDKTAKRYLHDDLPRICKALADHATSLGRTA